VKLKKSIIGRLWLYMTVLTIVALFISGFVMSQFFEDFYLDIKKNEMVNEGQQLITLILRGIEPVELLDISKFINAHAVVVDRQGLIKASSNLLKLKGSTLSSKQFAEILNGNMLVHKAYVPQFNAAMLMVALPIKTEGEVMGAVILYSPVTSIQKSIWQIRRLILIAAAGAVLVSTALSFVLSKTISKPLIRMKKVAENMADGDFDDRVEVVSDDEIGTLAKTINYLSEALKDNINALSQEKNQLHNVLLSMTDGVITFGSGDTVLIANPQAKAILGMEQYDEASSRKYEILMPLLEKVRQKKEHLIEEIKIDGKIVSVRLAPLMDEKSEILGIVAVLQDVTRERKLEHLRKEFVGNVSHELRTPLSYLQGYTEALLDGIVDNPDEQRKYLNIIMEETLRLRRLVNDLLDLSQIEGGHLKLKKDTMRIDKLIERVVKKLEPVLIKKGVSINADCCQLPIIEADEDRIEQVLINLLDNALRYTESGGKVKIKAITVEEGIIVSITNQGIGIPEDELPFIWERFYKVDKSRVRQTEGTGLGLAIVKNIIDVHGGRVWAKNFPEGCTTFSFFLPSKNK
jgi:two-component system sensor histidine kinase ResE